MAEVVLIQPKLGYTEKLVYFNSMPQALLMAASILAKHFDIKLIDQRIDKNWKSTLKKELEKKPICVGLSTITGIQIKYVLDICRFIKQHSDVPVIVGGIHPTMLPQQTARNKYIDIVVKGEGEVTFYNLVKALSEKKDLSKIKGIVYKSGKKIIETCNNPLLDLNTLPDLPFHLISVEDYLPQLINKPHFFLQTSRGCPYQCTFCFNNFFNKSKWRALKAELVLARIEKIIRKFGIKNFYFTDDNFFVDMKRAEKIIDMIIEKKLNIKWHVQGTRIDSVLKFSEEFLKKLEKSGCEKLIFGIESGSQRILDFIKKGITLEKVVKANKKLSKTSIYAQYSFMCGLPTENLDDIKKTIELSYKLMEDNPNAFITEYAIYTPYPKTELYDYIQKTTNQKPVLTLEGWIDCDYNNPNLLLWLSAKDKKWLERLEYASLFIDKKSRHYSRQWWIKLFAEVYRPIARFRLRNLYFNFMPELLMHKLLVRLIK